MEISLTKMSRNGQIVIPSNVRRDAKISEVDQFLVFNKGSTIVLKHIEKSELFDIVKTIDKSEEDIAKENYIVADSSMSDKEIKALLLK